MPIELPKGLPFSVDTWNPSSKRKRHHFLTHAHKDHSTGISTHYSYPIFCTHLTKTLLLQYHPQVCFRSISFYFILHVSRHPLKFFLCFFISGFCWIVFIYFLYCSWIILCSLELRWANRWSSMTLMERSQLWFSTQITALVI